MTENEILAVLRLQHVPNIGDVTAKKLISHCGSPTAVFTNKVHQLQKIDGIGTFTIRGLHDAEHREAAEAEYKYITDNNIAYTYFTDSEYPELSQTLYR